MSASLIVLLGAALVVASVIGLRLHAFLALTGAALIVVCMSPHEARLRTAMRGKAIEVAAYDPATGAVTPTAATAKLAKPGDFRLWDPRSQQDEGKGTGKVLPPASEEPNAAIAYAADPGSALPVAGDWLVPAAAWMAGQKTAGENPGEVVARGFGDSCTGIGLLIALAAVIGTCLMESGAAERIVLALRNLLGEKRTPLAFLTSGYLLGIPVFFDTVFYLLLPLGKALYRKTGCNYILYILSIVAGATMTHSLVPPTPGPLFVADALGVHIGTMMLGGSIVGAIAAGGGYLYALWANARWTIAMPDSETPAENMRGEIVSLPPLLPSLIPILLPVALIGLASVAGVPSENGDEGWRSFLMLIGNKNIALALGTIAGLFLLAHAKRWNGRAVAKPVGEALESGGTILLITAAGGAFGYALRMTDIAGVVVGWFSGDKTWLLPAAFGITTAIRIAQGSATVAMITAAGILAPLATSLQLGYHPVYLALAIGCGSKPISWMNDSGFWIISRMTGMNEVETLRTASAMMAIMGIVGLVVTLVGAWLFPLV